MGKAVKRIHTFLIFALTAFLTALRAYQLCCLTDYSFGYILKGSEGSIILFYSLSFVLVALIALLLLENRGNPLQSPFESKSYMLCFFAILAGISMFCDFVFRVIIGFNYLTNGYEVKLNYFIPLCFSALTALVCAFYFIVAGVSFKTKKYSFIEFKYLHFAPLFWALCVIVASLTSNVDFIYGEEQLLNYAVLILAVVFYILFISAVDDKGKGLSALYIFGCLYGAFCMVLSLPRVIAFVNGADFGYADFSVIAYLFTGAFALSLSGTISGQKKKD